MLNYNIPTKLDKLCQIEEKSHNIKQNFRQTYITHAICTPYLLFLFLDYVRQEKFLISIYPQVHFFEILSPYKFSQKHGSILCITTRINKFYVCWTRCIIRYAITEIQNAKTYIRFLIHDLTTKIILIKLAFKFEYIKSYSLIY